MASGQKLVVSVIGDNRSFIQALEQSKTEAKKFAGSISTSLSSGSTVSVSKSFEPLLRNVRASKAEADALQTKLRGLSGGMDEAGSAASSLGAGLGRTIAGAGALTFAVSAAYQGSRRLSDALETTGAAALTVGGRFKNVAAALASQDIGGAFQALTAGAKTFQDLGIAVDQVTFKMDQFNASGRKIQDLPKWAQPAIESLKDMAAAVNSAQTAQDALADSTSRLGTVFRDVTGQAVIFKGAVDDLGGMRGPGAVDQINAALEVANRGKQGRPAPKPLGPSDRRANAIIVAQASGDLPEVLRLQKSVQADLAKAIANSHGNLKQRQQLARDYAMATAAVISTQKQIAAEAKSTKDAAAKAADQARSGAWAKIIAGLELGVSRAQLSKTLNDDVSKLQALKAGLQRQIKAGVDVAAAQAKLAQTEVAIANAQEKRRQAAAAAEQGRQFRGLGLSASGEEIVPGIDNLAKRLDAALGKIDSGQLKLSSKLVGHLRAARASIRREGKNLSDETRKQINEWVKAASGEGSKATKGPLTTTMAGNIGKILAGLPIGRDLEKQLRSRLSPFNSAGVALAGKPLTSGSTGPVVVENVNTVTLDGDVVGRSVTRSQQKAGRRNPRQKRGPNTRSGV